MMHVLFLLSFLCMTATVYSQRDPAMVLQGEIRDAFGRPLTTKNEVGTEGSTYLYDDYRPGRITVKGKTYPTINVKLNLEKNIVFFEQDGVEMVPTGEVASVEFLNITTGTYDKKFRRGFPEVNNNNNNTYYEVIDSGKAVLLKHIGIVTRQTRVYGEAAIMKKHEQTKSYFVFVNNKMIQLKRNDDLLEAFADKRVEVNAFISKNKIKPNREADLISLISFYNQL